MSTNKRFYMEAGEYSPDSICDEEEYSFIRDSVTNQRVYQAWLRNATEVKYQQELCDILNMCWEATATSQATDFYEAVDREITAGLLAGASSNYLNGLSMAKEIMEEITDNIEREQ